MTPLTTTTPHTHTHTHRKHTAASACRAYHSFWSAAEKSSWLNSSEACNPQGELSSFEAGGRALWLLSAGGMTDNLVRQLAETMFTNSERHCRDSSRQMHFLKKKQKKWFEWSECWRLKYGCAPGWRCCQTQLKTLSLHYVSFVRKGICIIDLRGEENSYIFFKKNYI